MNPNRRFVYEVVNSGLSLELITPEDVLEHVTPEVLAHHLPVGLKAKLLQASLNAERMTPSLVVDVIGVEALVEHAPMGVLWGCVRAAATRALQGQGEELVGNASSILARQGAMVSPPSMPASGSLVGGTNGGAAEDLSLKPSKTARPVTLSRQTGNMPRISTLSPRSQVLRRGPDAAGTPVGAFDAAARPDEPPDFEIVEETEVPSRQRTNTRGGNDDDTRPGSKP